MERAILPASYPKCQWSRCGSSCSGSRKTITTRRIASATITIEIRNDGKRAGLDISEDALELEEGRQGMNVCLNNNARSDAKLKCEVVTACGPLQLLVASNQKKHGYGRSH